MSTLTKLIEEYLQYCQARKGLDTKTIRAYRADLRDFGLYVESQNGDFLKKESIGNYVDFLHSEKAPRTVRRKIASIRAFYHYLT